MAYVTSPIKRHRASQGEMEIRAEFLIAYAAEQEPVTVRQLYYAAIVNDLPGVDKTESGYVKVQRQVLALRRAGRIPYSYVADSTRWMRKPRTYDSLEDALYSTARLYRRNLWRDCPDYCEIWIEKDALAGVILPVTDKYDCPLMVCKGFSSETFCFEAAENYSEIGKPVVVYHLGDFDRAGVDASNDLERKLMHFAAERGVSVEFSRIAVSKAQVAEMNLPTREPKRKSAADKKWPHSFACDLDAIPPSILRLIVQDAIQRHMPDEIMKPLLVAEQSERELLHIFAREAA